MTTGDLIGEYRTAFSRTFMSTRSEKPGSHVTQASSSASKRTALRSAKPASAAGSTSSIDTARALVGRHPPGAGSRRAGCRSVRRVGPRTPPRSPGAQPRPPATTPCGAACTVTAALMDARGVRRSCDTAARRAVLHGWLCTQFRAGCGSVAASSEMTWLREPAHTAREPVLGRGERLSLDTQQHCVVDGYVDELHGCNGLSVATVGPRGGHLVPRNVCGVSCSDERPCPG